MRLTVWRDRQVADAGRGGRRLGGDGRPVTGRVPTKRSGRGGPGCVRAAGRVRGRRVTRYSSSFGLHPQEDHQADQGERAATPIDDQHPACSRGSSRSSYIGRFLSHVRGCGKVFRSERVRFGRRDAPADRPIRNRVLPRPVSRHARRRPEKLRRSATHRAAPRTVPALAPSTEIGIADLSIASDRRRPVSSDSCRPGSRPIANAEVEHADGRQSAGRAAANSCTRTTSGTTPAASAASPPGTGNRPPRSCRKALTALKAHGAPRRRLRRRRRRRRPHLPAPAGVLQGGGQAAQASTRPATSSPRTALAVGVFFFLETDPAQDRRRPGARPRGPRRRPGPAARLPPGPDQRRRPARRRPAQSGPGPSSRCSSASTATPTRPSRGSTAAGSSCAQRFREAGLDVYVPSLSARLVSYKGLLTSPQFVGLLPRPARPGVRDRHRHLPPPLQRPTRSRTGRSPSRSGCSCHNGEINTDPHEPQRGPRLRPRPEPAAARRRPAHAEDERLGQPRRVGRVPDARAGLEPAAGPAAVASRRCGTPRPTSGARTRSTCSPTTGGRSAASRAWDGPAGIIATDGRVLVGLVDRMGLRPVRWCSDKRGWLYIGSRVRRLRPRQRRPSSPAASSSRGR